MKVRLVLADDTVVTVDISSLDAIPTLTLVGTDERGVETFVNQRYIVRAYSIEDPS